MTDTPPNSTTNVPHSIKVLQINCQKSQATTTHVAHAAITDYHCDLALIQEPYTNSQGTICGLPTGTRIFSTGHKPRAAIAVFNNYLSVCLLTHLSTEDITVAEICSPSSSSSSSSPNTRIFLVSGYSQLTTDNSPFLEQIQSIIDTLPNTPIIFSLDANSKSEAWGNPFEDPNGCNMREFIASNSLYLLNNGDHATFSVIRGRTLRESFIDLTFCTGSIVRQIHSWAVLLEESTSDHRYITYEIESSRPTADTTILSRRYNTRKADWQLFERTLSNLKPTIDSSLESDSIDAIADAITAAIENAASAAMPDKKTRQHPTPWWNSDLTEKRRTVNRLRKQFQRTSVEPQRSNKRDAYLAAFRSYKTDIVRAKQSSFREFCTIASNADPWGAVYRMCSSKRREKTLLRALKKSDGTHTTSSTETLKLLTDYYFPPQPSDTISEPDPPLSRPEAPDTPDDHPFTQMEVTAAINSMNPRKAPGEDRLTTDIIQHAFTTIGAQITTFFNLCLNRSEFPTKWKRSIIRFIPKPNPTTTDSPKAYRPICLLPVLGKALDGLMINRINWHMHSNGLLSPAQYGFVPQKSTVDAIRTVIEFAQTAKETSKHCLLISLDVSNAFNSAQWHLIKHQLRNKDCPRNLFLLADDYLRNRMVITETESDLIVQQQYEGCPQGSRSGPGFWNIFYDDLLRLTLPTGSSLNAYADDVMLMTSANSFDQLEATATESLTAIHRWGEQWSLKFDAAKTQALYIGIRKGRKPNINMNGQHIRILPVIRYLGVLIDSKLSFSEHITAQCAKARKAIFRLASLAKTRWGMGPTAIRTIYLGAIEPLLLYASPVWSHRALTARNKQKLRGVQGFAALCICKAYRTSPHDALRVIANILPIDIRVEEESTRYFAQRGIPVNLRTVPTTHPPTQPEPKFRFYHRLHPALRRTLWDEQALSPHSSFNCTVDIVIATHLSPTGIGAAYTAEETTSPANQQQQVKGTYRFHPNCTTTQAILHTMKEMLTWISGTFTGENISIRCPYPLALTALNEFDQTTPLSSPAITAYHQAALTNTIQLTTMTQALTLSLAKQAATEAASNLSILTYDKLPMNIFKKLVRDRAMQAWQSDWETGETGRWTFEFFPTIALRLRARHFSISHHLTQYLTNHGDFMAYLHRFHHRDSNKCTCSDQTREDTARHRLLECPRLQPLRDQLGTRAGTHIDRNTPPSIFFQSKEATKALNAFVQEASARTDSPTFQAVTRDWETPISTGNSHRQINLPSNFNSSIYN